MLRILGSSAQAQVILLKGSKVSYCFLFLVCHTLWIHVSLLSITCVLTLKQFLDEETNCHDYWSCPLGWLCLQGAGSTLFQFELLYLPIPQYRQCSQSLIQHTELQNWKIERRWDSLRVYHHTLRWPRRFFQPYTQPHCQYTPFVETAAITNYLQIL